MMKRIYIHGLGQTAHSWDKVIEASDNRDGIVCPDLPGLIGDKEPTYENLYAAFSKMCDAKDEELILCGLSLGGVLALNYAVEHVKKVKALVLIATPYKMPKAALMLQNIVFRFMPDSGFKGIGFTKRDFIKLCKSCLLYTSGITKVCKDSELCAAVKKAFEYDDSVIIEENIDGFEVGCAVLGRCV